MPNLEILEHINLLSEPTRARLCCVLERQELTVSELCTVMQLPQSSVSRQLKLLVDSGWLVRRQDGTRAFYSMDRSRSGSAEWRMWLLVREAIRASESWQQDEPRLEAVLAERRQRSQEFFSSQAGEWDRLRREMFGSRFDTLGLLGLIDPAWTVGDLGCGTGELSRALAPFVHRVIGVDRSAAMRKAARSALSGFGNVELRAGDLERLPIDDAELDAAALVLVLHHVPEPGQVLREALRVLRPGGVLLIADMMPHDHEEYRQQMGHVWLGFSEQSIQTQLEAAGFVRGRYLAQPADPQAKGPRLFVATGRVPVSVGEGEPAWSHAAAPPSSTTA